ncbi:hypothetical protein [Allosphingosinicella sp.]|uniref:hypothetical protein n=1 Tax=Allosphingosinicella sp. TaxID=2823234 RepID=UPI00378331AE
MFWTFEALALLVIFAVGFMPAFALRRRGGSVAATSIIAFFSEVLVAFLLFLIAGHYVGGESDRSYLAFGVAMSMPILVLLAMCVVVPILAFTRPGDEDPQA